MMEPMTESTSRIHRYAAANAAAGGQNRPLTACKRV